MSSHPSRIVFVAVSNRIDDHSVPRTRRKRALGVADDASFQDFLALCCSRLQLRGIQSITHATTGKAVRGMDDLQDIEDLLVEETPLDDKRAAATAVYVADRSLLEAAPAPALDGGAGSASVPYAPGSAAKRGGVRGSLAGADEHRVSLGARMNGAVDDDDDDDSGEGKYVRRAPWHRQLLQHVGFQGLATECLPVTNPQLVMDADAKKGGGGIARKSSRGRANTCTPARAFVACSLTACIATMILLYTRLSAS